MELQQNRILILLIALLFVPLVAAAPPFVPSLDTGYVIKFPEDFSIKQNQDHTFEFHVFNISNGMPKTSGISCYFHLYNSTGDHQLVMTLTAPTDQFDYEIVVGEGNFSHIGQYQYVFQCNSSALGGFVDVPFFVNATGLDDPQPLVLIFFMILFLSFCVLMVFGFIVSMDKFIQKRYTVYDYTINLGMYFAVLAFYIFETQYYQQPVMDQILYVFVYVGAFTHVLASSIFYFVSWIREATAKKNFQSGVTWP